MFYKVRIEANGIELSFKKLCKLFKLKMSGQ